MRDAGLVGWGLAGAAALLVGLLHQIVEQLVWKGLIDATMMTHGETDRQTETETDSDRDRDRQRLTERERDEYLVRPGSIPAATEKRIEKRRRRLFCLKTETVEYSVKDKSTLSVSPDQ